MNTLTQTLTRLALLHAQAGRCVLPGKDKRPVPELDRKEFRTRLPTKDEIKAWGRESGFTQLLFVCGRVSGYWALNMDSREAVEAAASDPDVPKTPVMAITPFGRHWYYKVPEGMKVLSDVIAIPDREILAADRRADVLGEGALAVMPPSLKGMNSRMVYGQTVYEWTCYGECPSEGRWADVPAWEPPWPGKLWERVCVPEHCEGARRQDGVPEWMRALAKEARP